MSDIVYILEQYYADAEEDVTLYYYASAEACYKSIARRIQNHIQDSETFDLSQLDVATFVKKINDMVKFGNFKGAFDIWLNDGELFSELCWNVSSEMVFAEDEIDNPIVFDDNSFEVLKEVIEEVKIEDSGEFVATDPGATCRGPCGNYNEYAYANKRDNTYICQQCKMMSQVFGGALT